MNTTTNAAPCNGLEACAACAIRTAAWHLANAHAASNSDDAAYFIGRAASLRRMALRLRRRGAAACERKREPLRDVFTGRLAFFGPSAAIALAAPPCAR